MYDFNIRWHLTVARAAKEIHEIGLAEVQRLRGEMDDVMSATGFTGSRAEFGIWVEMERRL